ncbi:MEDS domain-containing protein [Natrinema amylolyticum]|uniref:MEDS domain-containing protein n=1 Tax=Natrinema amylolyticum TaxID=2878679 RepID=UPI003CCD9511
MEPIGDHEHAHTNDHFALIYESQEEQFAAAIPFLRQGLDRGERCLYITYENSREEVVAAMREYGIDVDAALESGQLSIHDEQETYLRNETFDADETIDFIDAAIGEATEEYEALRMTGEMSSVLEEDPECEELVKCEAKANYLFDDVDGLALCQYNRNRFSAEVIRDVINTHPLLIHNGRVSHNVYYTPPEEFFGSQKPSREVDRLLGSLQEQTDTKAELQQREQYLRASYEITADPTLDFEEKLEQLLDLGRDRFDLDLGGMAMVDPDADRIEVEHVSGDHESYEPGLKLPLSETFCARTIEADDHVSIVDATAAGYDDRRVSSEYGFETYLGTILKVEGGPDRTLFFMSEESRETEFSEAERTFLNLTGQWIAYELERQQRERELCERTEHLNALIETTPECIKTVAPDGTLLQMNPAGLEMVEADTASDVTGGCVYDLIAPEHRERFREFNERICQGESGILEFDIIGLEGTRRHMESHAAPFQRPDGTTVQVALTRDVTGQKERETELRQTKNRFETVFKQSDDAIYLVDPDAGDIVDANPEACEKLGYTREELLSMELSELHPDEMEQVRAFVGEVREQGSGWTENLQCRTKHGEDIPAEVTASTVTLDGRSLVLANIRYIEERKKHERYQRELYEVIADQQASFDEKLDRLLELGRERFGLENGYFNRIDAGDHKFEVVDAVGPHDQIEPGAVDSLEGTYCETHLSSNKPLAVADVVDAGLDDLRAHDQYGLEAYFAATVRVDRREYGTLCFASKTQRKPFTEAERTFLDLMGQCIGYELEYRRRERFLRESHTITADPDRDFETKLEDLLDLGREWMNLDAAGLTHLPSWDERFLNEIAIGYGDDTGDESGELWTDPSDGCYCRQVLESDQPVGIADVRGTEWEDDEIHLEHGLTCYLGTKVMNGSTPYGTVWVGSTEARDREFTETERTFLDLIGQWASYEIEREHREQELKESNERLEQFAYAASHDLQEPLRMVSSYLQLLETQYADVFDEDGEEYLEFAVGGADRMREMIEGLLQYSRVETRGDPFEPVELETVFNDVLEDLQLQIEETDAEITAEELPRVEGDGNQLRQVVQNLLENAITYSGSSPPRVHIDAKRRKREWVISIHDNGIGIDPDNQDRVFDIFDRLHTHDEYEGTGLGLALCQRIVERHNGEIWVDSEPDEGSTFSLTLPAVDDK